MNFRKHRVFIHRHPGITKEHKTPEYKAKLLLAFFNLEEKIKNAELKATPDITDLRSFVERFNEDQDTLIARVDLGTGQRWYRLNNFEFIDCTNSLTVRELTLLLN